MSNKACKQCGIVKPLEDFDQYVSRSKGIKKSSTGYHTTCRSCERLANDVAIAAAQGFTDWSGLRKMFEQPGWTPILKPIREALGLESLRKNRESPLSRMQALNEQFKEEPDGNEDL